MNNSSSSETGAIVIAALFGLVAFLVAKLMIDWSFFGSLVTGVLVAIITWIVLWLGWGETTNDTNMDKASGANAGGASGVTAARAAGAATATAAADTARSTASTAKAKAAPKAAPKTKAVAADGKPATLSKARAGGADDLKQIKGVGPGLEKALNELGFFHFDQIASWRKAEIEWVDSRLKFKGRIMRDEWTKQCKILAKGGTPESFKKGGV